MEDDDEFGDLYTDVLQPLQMSSAIPQPPIQSTPQPPSRSIDLNDRILSDDEEILYGSKSSGKLEFDQPDLNLNLNKIDGAEVKTEKYWEAAPALDAGGRVLGSSSGLVKVEEKGFEQDLNFMDEVKGDASEIKEETLEENFGIEDAGEEEEFLIPGLSSSGARVLERGGKEGEGGDDWDDSDSEDDLQIVLNDNTSGGMMGMDGFGGQDEEEDEDGDNLVIVAGNADPNHHHPPMDELQDWGEDGSQAGEGGGERKDLLGGDVKADGVAAVGQKIGYGSHGYHPFHSQFKYVRPGAAPMPGAGPVATGGAAGQIRPPGSMLPFAGRGRGEWRPAGIKNVPPNMQKSFHPNYGTPGWGNSGVGRGFGSGLDFTLPSHKTIFEVDIDGFEEKPWRLQGIDISDFFNFGMNEESWKEYCKQLEQHRLEATMQSKIRVYESGRTEQEYDPDLPPELAAAAGHDISSENRNIGKIDVQSDLAKGSARARMQLPTGKAIQVETGFGERLPSIDTRPPRIRDSDAIIEIVLQRSPDDESIPENDCAEHLEEIPSKDNHKEGLEIEEDTGSEDHFDKPKPSYNGRKREVSGRTPFVGSNSMHDDVTATGDTVSPRLTDSQPLQDKKFVVDNQNEESTESVGHKHSPSSSPLTESQRFDHGDAMKDDVVAGDTITNETCKDEKSKRTMKKQKPTPRPEHSSAEREDLKPGRSGSRGRDEKHDRERHQMTIKGMEDQYSHRKWDPNQGYNRTHVKKGREPEVVWQDMRIEDMRIEDMRKRSHDDDMASRHRHKVRENDRSDKIEHRSRKLLENGGWKGEPDRDMTIMPPHKRDDGLKPRYNISDGMHMKRANDDVHAHRESTSRRKREREDNNLDHHKRDEDSHSFRYKEESRLLREKREREKVWVGHSRLKEESRSSEKDYRRERVDRGREDAYAAHGNKVVNEERISRHERVYTGSDRAHGVQDKKHKESQRKGKESDGAIHNSLTTSRRNREDHSSQKSERASSRGIHEQRANEQNPVSRRSSKKHKENASSEDEHQESKKGRSKLERWTSHKEKDFSLGIKPSASLDLKESDRYNNNGSSTKLLEDFSKPQEIVEKDDVMKNVYENEKPAEDKHLDTVEKLKKRSERFKLPMPSEKETVVIKKVEKEPLPLAQPETQPDYEVKPERPARKRRWTSG